jgi:hypothetical protein
VAITKYLSGTRFALSLQPFYLPNIDLIVSDCEATITFIIKSLFVWQKTEIFNNYWSPLQTEFEVKNQLF